jgi:hypothetical protein
MGSSTNEIIYGWKFEDLNGLTQNNPIFVPIKADNCDVVLTVGDYKGHSTKKHMHITVTSVPFVETCALNKLWH